MNIHLPALKVGLILYLSVNFAATVFPQENFGQVSVCFYDTGEFSLSSSKDKKESVISILTGINPDILILAGVGDLDSLNELKKTVKSAKFAKMVSGDDKTRHLAVISRLEPLEFHPITDLKYKIKDVELPVKRGFLHCVFKSGTYKFHLIGADLQSRDKVENFNQTDMRRYEARLLRYHVTALIKENIGNNIIVAGNLNDTCGMASIKEIYNRRFDIVKRLFDIRPIDSLRTSWTYWDCKSDDYERIDYIIGTSSILPEIVREKTYICQDPRWNSASMHRPLIVTIDCREGNPWSKEKIESIYPNAIYEGPASHFEEDKPVGEKPKRNPPSKKE